MRVFMKKYGDNILTFLLLAVFAFGGFVAYFFIYSRQISGDIVFYFSGLLVFALLVLFVKYRREVANKKLTAVLSIVESVGSIGSFELNMDTENFYLSDKSASFLGLDGRKEVSFLTFIDAVAEDEKTSVYDFIFVQCAHSGKNILIYFATAKDKRLLKLTAVPVFCKKGTVRGVQGLLEDVTEQVKAKQEREMLFRQSRDGIAILDMETYFIDVNSAYELMTGYTRDELLSKSCLELTHKDDLSGTMEMMKKLMEKGYYDMFEKRCVRKNGTYVSVQMNLTMLPNGTIMVTTRDVSEIKVYQDRLAESEKHLRQLFEASPIPLCLIDDRSKPVLVNKMFTEIFGYELGDMNAVKTWWHLAFPDEEYRNAARDRWKDYTAKVIRGENPHPIQATVTCKNYTTKEIVFLYSVIDNMGIIAFYDITERVEAENRLQEYISIVDWNVLVVRSDENAGMTSVSTAFCRLFGYTEEELIGKPAMMINHEEFLRDVQPFVMETILSGRIWNGEIKKVTKNGDIVWVQSMIQPVFKNGVRTGFLSISTDVTDKKRIEILSVTDKLTGVYNRIRLDEVLSAEFVRFKRYEQSYSVIMFDIDYFKRVNDTYGHLAGDDVLKSLARLIKQSIRESDIFGRWGGEEFLVVCCGTDIEGAQNLAEKLRSKVEMFSFPAVDRLTCSFGVAQVDDAGTDNMIKRADEALYRAKQSGRNKVEI